MKFLVFDLDDTLFPERDFVLSGFRAVGQWLYDSYDTDGFYEIAFNLFESGVRGNTFNRALLELGLKENKSMIQTMLDVYRNHKPGLSLHEDAQWSINHYQNNILGIITDGFLRVQKNKVEALNLNSSFMHIIYTDAYGRKNWKPSPVPYQAMMQRRGCSDLPLTYIGDNPIKDFVTAKQLGWKTIHLCRPNGEYSKVVVEKDYQADIRIESLYELANIL